MERSFFCVISIVADQQRIIAISIYVDEYKEEY